MDVGYVKQIIYTSVVYLNFFLIGITRGFPNLIGKHLIGHADLINDDNDISWIASICVLPNPIGSLVAGVLMDYFGRITTLKIGTVLFSVSWFVVAITSDKLFLYAAFFGVGISVGMALISSVYVAEISSDHNRSVLLSLFIVFFTIGVMVSYVVTYFLHWRWSAWTFAALSAIICALLFVLEESPLWYAKQSKRDEAIRVLQRLRQLSYGEAEKEYETVANTLRLDEKRAKNVGSHLLGSWKPFCILVLFQICVQGSGYSLLLAYSRRLFVDIRFPVDNNVMALTYSVAIFVSSFFAPFAALYGNRKKLVAISSVGMTAALVAVLASMSTSDDRYAWIIQAGVYVYVFFSTFGSVMVSECMPSELYRAEVRGFMCGITQAYSTIMQGTLIKVFPWFLAATSVSCVMLTFTAFSAATLLFAVYVLPETKDKTLQQIQDQYFAPKRSRCVEKCNEIDTHDESTE